MADRRRNTLVLLLVALLLAASAVVIATKPTRLGLDLKGGVSFIYKGIPTAHAKVNPESLNRAINIMRKRVDQLGVAQPEIQLYGANEINVSLPDVTNVKRAEDQVGKTAQLLFYDWEPNVIGPSGNPEPTNTAVTCGGGREPASVACGLPEYKAVLRAAKRKPYLYPNATTLEKGCTAAQVHGCIFGAWYLIDTKHEKMLCAGGKPICGPADTQAELYADGYKPPAGASREGRARQPRHRAGAGAPRRIPEQSRQGRTQQLLRAQRQPGARRRQHQQPAAGLPERRRRLGAAGRHLRFRSNTARRCSNGSPRKSPNAAKTPSCRASPRKQRCSISRSCSTNK